MKTETITVNKTEQNPNGVQIELVQPESKLEEGVLNYLLASFLRDAKKRERVPYALPDNFTVSHQGRGSFLVSAFAVAQPGETPGYYQPPRPIAVIGVAMFGNRFDVIHAEINPEQMRQRMAAAQQQQQQAAPEPPAHATATGDAAEQGNG